MVVEVDEAASTNGQNSLIGVDDQGFVWAIDDGPKLIENDSDHDANSDDDPTSLNSSLIVAADPQEMENQAADVLDEDQLNDVVVTDIAPQYCLDFTWNHEQGQSSAHEEHSTDSDSTRCSSPSSEEAILLQQGEETRRKLVAFLWANRPKED